MTPLEQQIESQLAAISPESIFLYLVSFILPLPHNYLLTLYNFINQALTFTQANYLPILITLFLLAIMYWSLKLYLYKRSSAVPMSLLQITPPSSVKQTPLSTQEFLTAIHQTSMTKTKILKFFTIKRLYSLELVSTREGGIRYYLRIPSEDVSIVKKNVISYLHNVTVEEVNDFMPVEDNKVTLDDVWWNITELKLLNDFTFPLSNKEQLSDYDPVAYITGQMTKLTSYDEVIYLQIVATPITSSTHKKTINKIVNLLTATENSYDIAPYLPKSIVALIQELPIRTIRFILFFTIGILFWQLNFILFVLSLGKIKMLFIEAFKYNPQAVELNEHQQVLYYNINNKLKQNLFETSLRVFTATKKREDLASRQRGILNSFANFTYPQYQQFTSKNPQYLLLDSLYQNIRIFRLKNRLLNFINNPILSVSELSDLYHLPYTPTTKTEGLVKEKAKTLPAPLSLKKQQIDLDIIFAKNRYHEEETNIGLTLDERRRHVYTIGKTGTGKSTLLKTMIHQDIANNKGISVIDPHGDLIQDILQFIPKNRIKDVILFDPTDFDYPIGLNLLQITPGLNKQELTKEKDFVASNLNSIFTKLYPARAMGHRMEYILRNATLTALETENPTLLTIQRILTEKQYRTKIVDQMENKIIQLYWRNEFAKMGSYQKAEAISPITNKIGRFISSPISSNILGQQRSKLDFDDVVNNNKILLCDLAKGKIGEDMSTLFGGLITAKIQLAVLKKVSIEESERKDFYLYIDEFQNFATSSLAEIMSEARKYRLNAILAHQTFAQVEDKDLVKVILANTGTIISFLTSAHDEDYILPNLLPEVVKGDLLNLPWYQFYIKIHSKTPQESFSGHTLHESYTSSKKLAESIKLHSRRLYGTPIEQVQKEIMESLPIPQTKRTVSSYTKDVEKII